MLTQFLTGFLTVGILPDVTPYSVRTNFRESFGSPSMVRLNG
jgi:hypothetical protein